MTAAYIAWLVPLAIGVVFGFVWGWTRGQASAPPTDGISTEEARRQGYTKGWDDCRDQCLRVARANDFAAVERRIGALEPKW